MRYNASSKRSDISVTFILFVIGILAIVYAIGVPCFVRARPQGMVTACKSNLKNIGTALGMYSTDNGGTFPDSMDRLTANAAYLRSLPQCPAAGSMSYIYSVSEDRKAYSVWCSGLNHKPVGITQAGYPQYNSIEGLVVPAVAP